MTKKTDARGVRTHFSYNLPGGGGLDPLNRVQTRTFDTNGPLQPGLVIPNTWGVVVAYEYMATGDRSRIKKIETQAVLTEEYAYDAQARVSECKQTVAGRPAFRTGYLYDTLVRVKNMGRSG